MNSYLLLNNFYFDSFLLKPFAKLFSIIVLSLFLLSSLVLIFQMKKLGSELALAKILTLDFENLILENQKLGIDLSQNIDSFSEEQLFSQFSFQKIEKIHFVKVQEQVAQK